MLSAGLKKGLLDDGAQDVMARILGYMPVDGCTQELARERHMRNRCAVCRKRVPERRRCKVCKQVWYCGRAHQVLHWEEHRQVCRPALAKAMAVVVRSSSNKKGREGGAKRMEVEEQ